MAHARSARQGLHSFSELEYWCSIISQLPWDPLSTIICETDSGPEFLFWCCEWGQTQVWRGDNSGDPCIKIHHPASLTLSFTMRHFARGRRQTMDTELVRVYTGEEIFWGHSSRRLHTSHCTVNARRKRSLQKLWTIRDSLCSVKSVIHKWICTHTGSVPIPYLTLLHLQLLVLLSARKLYVRPKWKKLYLTASLQGRSQQTRGLSASGLNTASVFFFYVKVAQTSRSQHRKNTKKMLTTLSSFVACSPGSSENWEKWGWRWSKRGKDRKKSKRKEKKKEEIETQRGWSCGMWYRTDCRKREEKTKERRGEEDVMQTFVNYILQNWYTYFILCTECEAEGTAVCECVWTLAC